MNALPPAFDTTPDANRTSIAGAGDSYTRLRWAAVAEAAQVVAALAGLDSEPATPELHDFPAKLESAEAWRRERAQNGVDDLAAVMEPGITALLAINARGADPRPAAMALWSEFIAARAAIVSLLPSTGAPESRRPV